MLAGMAKRFQKSASKCMPIPGAVFTQKYSSARISLGEAAMGHIASPLFGFGAFVGVARIALFLLFLGGIGT